MKDKCRSSGAIYVERGTGYTNAFKQLKKCMSDSDTAYLLDVYNAHFIQKRQHGVSFSSNRNLVVPSTGRERAMFAYLS